MASTRTWQNRFPFAVLACVLIVALSGIPRLVRLRTGRTRLIQSLALL